MFEFGIYRCIVKPFLINTLIDFRHKCKKIITMGFVFIVQKCHVKKKDIRKFLDGIYVSEKSKIVEEE